MATKKSSSTPVSTKAIDNLINQALAIEDQSAQVAGSLGFVARAMVMATLPHSKVKGNEFSRVNGNYTMVILAPSNVGLPYGVIPRLLLAWLTTQAVKTKKRDIEMGESLSKFMEELGMLPTGGRWGSITQLKEQATRLFSSNISAIYRDEKGVKLINQNITDRAVLWWDKKPTDQGTLWNSTVRLSEQFFNEVVDRPIPIDMRALHALKKSPLALDIYNWMTYRASYLNKPTTITWDSLAMQFGSNYKEVRNFKTAFIEELKKVSIVYSAVDVTHTPEGLTIKPMLTHIEKKKKPVLRVKSSKI